MSLAETSACRQHSLDLCELLGQPKPTGADLEGSTNVINGIKRVCAFDFTGPDPLYYEVL